MKKTSLKDYLNETLGEDIAKKVNRAFEVVGDIAIIEINLGLDKHSKQIGEALLKTNKSIKTVLKKSGIHQGEFRTQDLTYVAGENKKETQYTENGIRLKINPQTVYFSARLSTERANLMDKLEPDKRVLVMFSGIGPYSFVAMKKQPDVKNITSIEINPEGHKYALENLELNKNLIKKSKDYKQITQFIKDNNISFHEKELIRLINNLKYTFINEDVRRIIPELKPKKYTRKIPNYHNELFTMSPKDISDFLKSVDFKEIFIDIDNLEDKTKLKNLFIIFSEKFNFILKTNNKKYIFDNYITKTYLLDVLGGDNIEDINKFDEIYMPLPKDSSLFLNEAFKVAKEGTIIHTYDFVSYKDFPDKTQKSIKDIAKKNNVKIQIIQTRKVGQYSPRKYRVCCDFKIIS